MNQLETNFMKASTAKTVTLPESPVFPQMPHTLRPNPESTNPKSTKRDNIFSKSRDLREDRGTREMKTTRNDQTFQHGK